MAAVERLEEMGGAAADLGFLGYLRPLRGMGAIYLPRYPLKFGGCSIESGKFFGGDG